MNPAPSLPASQELFHTVDGRKVSRFFPASNVDGELASDFRSRIPGAGSHLYYRKRSLSMVVGSPDDLELEPHPSYGRVRDGEDTCFAYRGLRRMVFVPSLRAYVVDDHHYLYYALWEARSLGLFTETPWLYHFDLHHDMAPVAEPPPASPDLATQAEYTIRRLRVGNHMSAVMQAGLCRGVTWVTTPENLAYKCSDMIEPPANLELVPWQYLRKKRMEPGAVVSLDWDFLSAMFNEGRAQSMVSARAVDWFTTWWASLGLHRNYSMICIATSPGYTEETSLIPGVKRFLRALASLSRFVPI